MRRPGTDPARGVYAGAAPAWAELASRAYTPLARHLVDRCPVPLAGAFVLDAGAGTGAASGVLAERGATVIAADLEAAMLVHGRSRRPPAVVADVVALPFRVAVFDAVVAAFVLNHVAAPAAALAELAGVTRAGGPVLASTFASDRAAAKNAFDEVAARHGWQPPAWYHVLRARQAAFGTAVQLCEAAEAAGLVAVQVHDGCVDVALEDPADVVDSRLGMPQYRTWLARLAPATRRRVEGEAAAAIAVHGERFQPRVLELVARAA